MSATVQSELHLELIATRLRLVCPGDLLEPYRRVFGRFRTEPGAVDLEVRIQRDNGHFAVDLVANGDSDTAILDTEVLTFGYVYAQVLDRVVRSDPRLLCIHGAALARNGRGLVVAGPSGQGKSTLCLALARVGFRVLSDEVAPIERQSARLHAFPMPVGCRSGTRSLLGLSAAGTTDGKRISLAKTFIDPWSASGAIPGPVPLGAVVVLDADEPRIPETRRYRLWADPLAWDVVPELLRLDGIASASIGGSALALEVRPDVWLAPAVEAILARHGVLVTEVEELDRPGADHRGEPRRIELSRAEGIVALVKNLRGFGQLDDLARAEPGGFAGLLADLVQRWRGVAFHRLTPGKLDGMVREVEAVMPP